MEFVGLRPKMYCVIDEKDVIYNAAKGVPRNVIIDGKRVSVKNIELYKRVLEAENKNDAVMAHSNASTIKSLKLAQWNKPRH